MNIKDLLDGRTAPDGSPRTSLFVAERIHNISKDSPHLGKCTVCVRGCERKRKFAPRVRVILAVRLSIRLSYQDNFQPQCSSGTRHALPLLATYQYTYIARLSPLQRDELLCFRMDHAYAMKTMTRLGRWGRFKLDGRRMKAAANHGPFRGLFRVSIGCDVSALLCCATTIRSLFHSQSHNLVTISFSLMSHRHRV